MEITRLGRRREVCKALGGISQTSLYNLEKADPSFPRHWLLTPRCAVWDMGEVEAWLQARRVAPARPAPAPDHTLRKSCPGKGKRAAA